MTMSTRGSTLQRSIAMTMELLREHDKTQPGEVDQICALIVQHIRSFRSHVLLAPGVLP